MKEFKIKQDAVDKLANYLHEMPFKYAHVVIDLLNAGLVEIEEQNKGSTEIKEKEKEEVK